MAKPIVVWGLAGIAVVGIAATAASAWVLTRPEETTRVPMALPSVSMTPSTAAPETPEASVDVDPLYTGDELLWFLLTDDELVDLFGAVDIVGPSADTTLPADAGGGFEVTPATCYPLLSGWVTSTVGERRTTWTDATGTAWYMSARQVFSPERAMEDYDYLSLTDECATFTAGSYDGGVGVTFTREAEASAPRARIAVGRVESESYQDLDRWAATVIHGNTVVAIDAYARELPEIDAQALADALAAHAADAYAKLSSRLN